jgi:hypothetical protein
MAKRGKQAYRVGKRYPHGVKMSHDGKQVPAWRRGIANFTKSSIHDDRIINCPDDSLGAITRADGSTGAHDR